MEESERIQAWKQTNEERILRQWNKKNRRFFLSIIFVLWGVALVYVILYGFQSPLTSNWYFYFSLLYPLMIWWGYQKKSRSILRKRKEQEEQESK